MYETQQQVVFCDQRPARRDGLISTVTSRKVGLRIGACSVRLLRALLAGALVMSLASITAADEKVVCQPLQSSDAVAHETGPVDMHDGESSAEAALKAYVAASDAGDLDAVLMMVDPPIRRLLIPEIAIERYAIDASLIDRGLFGDRELFPGGLIFQFAARDLVRTRRIEKLDTRVINKNQTVFTVVATERSYQEESDQRVVRQILAVRNGGKWYVFRPFGLVFGTLGDRWFGNLGPDRLPTIVKTKRRSDDDEIREGADYEIESLVAFEDLHAEFVKTASDPKVEECIQLAAKIRHHYRKVVNRAIRGDFAKRKALHDAFGPIEPWIDQVDELMLAVFRNAYVRLAEKLHRKGSTQTPCRMAK